MEVARSPFGDFEQAPSKEKFRETVAEDYYSANTRDDAGGQSLENALKLHFPKPLMRKVRTSRRHLLPEKKLSMEHGTYQACLWACGCGDMSTPSFGSHLNPISTRGADYAQPILVSTPSFESHRHA